MVRYWSQPPQTSVVTLLVGVPAAIQKGIIAPKLKVIVKTIVEDTGALRDRRRHRLGRLLLLHPHTTIALPRTTSW